MADKSKVYGYEVKVDSYKTVTRERDPNEEWDGDDTYSSYNVKGLVPSQQYGDVAVPFKVEHDKEYFLVYGIYSTGNSFGSDTDGGFAIVDLFATFEKAQAVAEILKKHNKEYYDNEYNNGGKFDYNVKYKDEDDKEKKFHVPWCGFFETLSSIIVERIRLIGDHDDDDQYVDLYSHPTAKIKYQ